MTSRALIGFAICAGLAACQTDPSYFACVNDTNCPTDYICGSSNFCVLGTRPADSGTMVGGDAGDSGAVDAGDSGPAFDGGDAGVADAGDGGMDAGTPDAGPPSWMLQSPAANPSARADVAMAYDSARGVTVLFGGWGLNPSPDGGGGFTAFGDTWEWPGPNWTSRNVTPSPPARADSAMADDSARGVVVMFGGSTDLSTSNVRDDTWEWDGFSWTQRMPVNYPSARTGHAMAYDSLRGVTVLFGGDDPNGSNDTWEWDGADWSKQSPATSPSVRAFSAMAFDSIRGVTVLFGGQGQFALQDGGSADSGNDTWEWDGANWTQKMPAASPPGSYGFGMAFDAATGLTTMFDGNYAAIWQWDGTNWNRPTPPTAPAFRKGSAIVNDDRNHVSVLFGGIVDNTGTIQTWEYGRQPPATPDGGFTTGWQCDVPDAGVPATPFDGGPGVLPNSCKDIPAGNACGIYTTTHGGVYCDMALDNGGWTLVLAYNHPASGLDPLVVGTIPTDPVNGYSNMMNGQIQDFGFSELRFYCTGSHLFGGPIHFTTSNPNILAYASGTSSTNDSSYWDTGFTLLAGAGSYLPQQVTTTMVDSAAPLTDFPFGQMNLEFWTIAGPGSLEPAWDCGTDDPDGSSYKNSHLFQVWGR